METPGERMKYFIEQVIGIGVPVFSEIVGVQSKTIYNIIGNEIGSIIGKSTSEKIKKQYPKFPFIWIKKGGEIPFTDTAERHVYSSPEGEEIKLRDKKITILTEEISFLNKRIESFTSQLTRYEKEIGRLEKLLDKKPD